MIEERLDRSGHRGKRIFLLALASVWLASCDLEGTQDVPGDVHRFDPLASLTKITAAAGSGAQLRKLETRFVREDGTQDLEASYIGYSAVDTYELVRPSGKREDTSAPLGARAPVAPFEIVEITVQKPHWVSQSINGGDPERKKHRGMEVAVRGPAQEKDGIAAPTCSFAKLWTAAKEHGAPAGAVAVITYDASGYDFHIDGTEVRFRFDASCQLRAGGK